MLWVCPDEHRAKPPERVAIGTRARRTRVEAMRDAIASIIVLLGIFAALSGLLFFFQGIGVVQGSPMTGTTTWTVLGPIIALIGVAVAYTGWRMRKR
jgi:hypothetical protein